MGTFINDKGEFGWVGSVGTDGQFTGAITHLGYPLFFKENTHMLFGDAKASVDAILKAL